MWHDCPWDSHQQSVNLILTKDKWKIYLRISLLRPKLTLLKLSPALPPVNRNRCENWTYFHWKISLNHLGVKLKLYMKHRWDASINFCIYRPFLSFHTWPSQAVFCQILKIISCEYHQAKQGMKYIRVHACIICQQFLDPSSDMTTTAITSSWMVDVFQCYV